VAVPDQIAVLLALSVGLFDKVPLEKVPDGVRALRDAAAKMPPDVAGRLSSADKLSDADRKVILDLATRALAPFQPPPEPKPKTESAPEKKAAGNPTPAAKPGPPPKSAGAAPPPPKPAAQPSAAARPGGTPAPEAKPAPPAKAAGKKAP
jgi:F-type H+-transporting ATPase subunit alpha